MPVIFTPPGSVTSLETRRSIRCSGNPLSALREMTLPTANVVGPSNRSAAAGLIASGAVTYRVVPGLHHKNYGAYNSRVNSPTFGDPRQNLLNAYQPRVGQLAFKVSFSCRGSREFLTYVPHVGSSREFTWVPHERSSHAFLTWVHVGSARRFRTSVHESSRPNLREDACEPTSGTYVRNSCEGTYVNRRQELV
jgi:hypothetical protein